MQHQQLFGTKRVAEILEIPEWRVKNFAEGPTYGLPPTQALGTGRGSRRLYDITGVLHVAIATVLVNSGFMPEVVGEAMAKIKEADVHGIHPESSAQGSSKNGLVLIRVNCKWVLRKPSEATTTVKKVLAHEGDGYGVFLLNVSSLVQAVRRKVQG